MAPEAFAEWGWRIPFLISIFLLAISLWIRLKLNESPVFLKIKEESATSKAPFAEAFGTWSNLKLVLIALFGVVAGQAVSFYASTFYMLFFLDRVLKVDGFTANTIVLAGLVIGGPFYVFFGWLSDRIGRKPIIMGGLALTALTSFPVFSTLIDAANPALAAAQKATPVVVAADRASCSLQFDPVGRNKFDNSGCDIAKAYLTRAGVSYKNAPLTSGAEIRIGETVVAAPDPAGLDAEARKAVIAAFGAKVDGALRAAGYPDKVDPARMNKPLMVALIAFFVAVQTMSYGPLAAMLVELFPARIRYTSMSLPYHVGNGWFGGFLPTTAFAIVAATGSALAGLWYPVIVTAVSFVIGMALLPETRGRDVS
jgi:MFS family permease